MQSPYRIMFLFGTRAEALKLAPVIKLARTDLDTWQPLVVTTMQQSQQEVLQQTLDYLKIKSDFDLAREANQTADPVEGLSFLLHNLNNVVNAGQPGGLLSPPTNWPY